MRFQKSIIIIFSILIVSCVLFYFFVLPRFSIISGYTAKNMCSCVFVAGMDEKRVLDEDLNFGPLSLANVSVDYENRMVTSRVFGMKEKIAIYKDHLGCALVHNINPEEVYRFKSSWNFEKFDSLEYWFSHIDTIDYLTSSQKQALSEAVNWAFEEDLSRYGEKNTRAVIVLYKGQLVAEKYAKGFDKNVKQLGWSMTKSLTASMVGVLADNRKIDLEEEINIPDWQYDERKKITWKDLMQMNSGLKWSENYATLSNAVLMLFNSDDIGGYAQNIQLESEPENVWQYSSGTSNIIARNIRQVFSSQEEYILFPYANLFYRIGMYSLVMETDALGYFVGSSYAWATPLDWVKLGQLYLQNGFWAGENIISEDWVSFVRQPAPNSNEKFGAHFWLNLGGSLTDVPADTYSMNGFQGQRLFIIPSEEMVVLRLGLTYDDDFDFNKWLKDIIDSIHAGND